MTTPLSNSPADVLRYALIALGLGILPVPGTNYTATSWPTSTGQELDSPDNTATTYDTTGIKDGRSMTDGDVVEHPGVQVRVRATDDPTAQTQAWILANAVDRLIIGTNLTIGTHTYTIYAVSRKGNPARLSQETPTSRRPVWTFNVTVTLTQTS